MRQNEIIFGNDISDENGNVVGQSQVSRKQEIVFLALSEPIRSELKRLARKGTRFCDFVKFTPN